MKVSYQWLNEYLPLEKNQIEPNALAEKLALTSVDINEVYSPSDGLSNIVVGQIESVTPHPDSDHLNLCQVKISEGAVVQIVCGAPNVSQAAGKKVIVALAGAKLKDGTKIKRGKIRGEESNGMLMKKASGSCQTMPRWAMPSLATWEWMIQSLTQI